MKVVLQTFILNLGLIVFFSLFYFILPEGSFKTTNDVYVAKYIDCFTFSTTIQAGVGITTMTPNTDFAKLLVSCHQICLIGLNVILLYIFLKHHIKHHRKHH